MLSGLNIYPGADVLVRVSTYGYPDGTDGQNSPKVIVHHIAEGHWSTLINATWWVSTRKSVHFAVSKSGLVAQLVGINDAAWGNGLITNPTWPGTLPVPVGANPNLHSISIEHEGFTGEPWPDAQYQASLRLTRWLCERFNISTDNIIGHYRIDSVNRWNCPGSAWPIERMRNDIGEESMPLPEGFDELWPHLRALAVAAKRGGFSAAEDGPPTDDDESRAIRKLGALFERVQFTDDELNDESRRTPPTLKAVLLDLGKVAAQYVPPAPVVQPEAATAISPEQWAALHQEQ